jgi:hypothetical protein
MCRTAFDSAVLPTIQPMLEILDNCRRNQAFFVFEEPVALARAGLEAGRPYSFRNSSFALSRTRRRWSVKFVPARLISKFNIDIAERNGLDLRR